MIAGEKLAKRFDSDASGLSTFCKKAMQAVLGRRIERPELAERVGRIVGRSRQVEGPKPSRFQWDGLLLILTASRCAKLEKHIFQ